MSTFAELRSDIVSMRLLGAPAGSCAAWLSVVNRAERDGKPLPSWDELERIAPSLPIDRTVLGLEPHG